MIQINKTKGTAGLRKGSPSLRRCVSCRQMIDQRQLARVTKSPEGVFALDTAGKAPGRGAYVCKNAECIQKALKTKGLDRSFKQKVPQEVYTALERLAANE